MWQREVNWLPCSHCTWKFCFQFTELKSVTESISHSFSIQNGIKRGFHGMCGSPLQCTAYNELYCLGAISCDRKGPELGNSQPRTVPQLMRPHRTLDEVFPLTWRILVLSQLFLSHIFICFICVHIWATARLAGIGSRLLPCGIQESNSGCQSWKQRTKPSY